jgi:hypothetical protein
MPNVYYANTDDKLATLVLYSLPNWGDETGNGILNTNAVTAALRTKGSFKDVVGGLEFWETALTQKGPNAKWQGKNDDMSTIAPDPSKKLAFPPKVFTNSVPVNELDIAVNRGKPAIKKWVGDLRLQATTTTENEFNSGLWKSSPGSDDPESIPNLISTTNTTGTIGGQNRANSKVFQNGYDSTSITDLGSEAGIVQLLINVTKFSVGKTKADLIVASEARFASLQGFLAANRRWIGNEAMAKLGFTTIMLTPDCMIVYENTNVRNSENTIGVSSVYGINSKWMTIKHLTEEGKRAGWTVTFERIGRTLNKAVYFTWFGNLCTVLPCAHWVMDSVTG